jgi:hypothetical protein
MKQTTHTIPNQFRREVSSIRELGGRFGRICDDALRRRG